MAPRRTKYSNEFGTAVSNSLTAAGLDQPKFAARINRSTAYVNQHITGRKLPTADWADLVADTLNLPEAERLRLHAAAARVNGFRVGETIGQIDLTKK